MYFSENRSKSARVRWSAADHPQRALYAAVRMQEELRRYSTKVVADGGMPIEARVGINTGEVVVRSIATGAGQVASGVEPAPSV